MRFFMTVLLLLTAAPVWAQESSGTAFAVARGLLVTNYHVIEGCGSIRIISPDGSRPALVVKSESVIDLALLRVFGLAGGIAKLRNPSVVHLGEQVMVFGFPLAGALASSGNFTTGVVSAVQGLRNDGGVIQITAPIQPGSSGGPVMDSAGVVIGVVQSKLDALRVSRAIGDIPQNVNFAISLDVLTDFLVQSNVHYQQASRLSSLDTERIAQMAQGFTFRIECQSRTDKEAAAIRVNPPLFTGLIRIAHAAPLTGPLAYLGKDNQNGARLAIDEANAKGVTIGGEKIVFELISEDDEGKEKKSSIIAQKFVDAKVAGVVGHLNSDATIPASAIYSQAGIPMISGSATSPKLTEQGFKIVFRTVGRDDQQGPAIASYLISEHKPKSVAVIDDATAYGEGLANGVEKTLKAAGIAVLPREKGTAQTRDWRAILTKLYGENPDAIFYGGMDSSAGPLIKQAREFGIKAVFAFGDGACTDSRMNELAGPASEGLICSQNGIPVQAARRTFLDAYMAKFKSYPLTYAPYTYDATNLLIAAMQQADSVEPAKYLPKLANISYRGATGKIEFDAKGDRKDSEITIFTMKGGEIEPRAIVKGGKAIKLEDFVKSAAGQK